MSSVTNKNLVEIFPFQVSRKELEARSEDEQAYFGLLNYAASELNVLQRIYISLSHSLEGEEWIDAAIMIQRNTLLRVWSAKLFEILDSVKTISKLKRLDRSVFDLSRSAIFEAQSLVEHGGYSLSRNFRHESTSHYSFNAAKKNLSHLPRNADCNMYLHEMDGNSWYPMGEELMFIGRLNRHGANLTSKAEVAEGLDHWMEWNLEANKWMRSTHVAAFKEIIEKHAPDRFARKASKWVNPRLVGEVSPPTTPLFFKKSQK